MKLFIDRDLGKRLGRALRAVGVSVVLHIDRYPNADAESVPDSVWIAAATEQGEVILTRDGRIRRMSAELAAVVAAKASCFVLETGNASPLDYLRAVMAAWPRMVEIVGSEIQPIMYVRHLPTRPGDPTISGTGRCRAPPGRAFRTPLQRDPAWPAGP